MKKQHKFYFNAYVTWDDEPHLVEITDDDVLEVAALKQKLDALTHSECSEDPEGDWFEICEVLHIPTYAEILMVSRIVEIVD